MKYSIIIAIFLFAASTFGFANPDECCSKDKATLSKICGVPESEATVSSDENTINTVAALSIDVKDDKKKDSADQKSVKENKTKDDAACCSAKGEKKAPKKTE